MAERNPCLFLQNRNDHTAEQDRALFESLFAGREGIIQPTDLAVSQNGTPNMSVNVAAGRCVVDGDDNAAQGFYLCWNDAVKNVTIAAADPTNPRRDLVVARVRDAFYTGATNAWDIFVVTGTPAGSPVDPAIPNNALLLARVSVAASATSITNANITDLRVRANALNGIVPVTAANAPSSPTQGQVIYVTDANLPAGAVAPQTATRPNTPGAYVFDGTKWNPLAWNTAWGIMGRGVATADQTPITTVTDLTNLSVTYTGVANRWLCVKVEGLVTSSVVGDLIVGYITDNANAIKGRWAQAVQVGAGGIGLKQFGSVELTSTTGSITYKARLERNSGTGNVTLQANAAYPASIVIEDIGPAGQPT